MQFDSNRIEQSEKFFQKMNQRRTIRQFSQEPVDKKILFNAIKTAGTAPSGANSQPWHFALITSQEMKDKIRTAAEIVEAEFYNGKASKEWIEDLKPFGTNSQKPYLSQAPALIAVFSRIHHLNSLGECNRTYYPVESTGIATGILLTALHTSGLATLTHTPKPMIFLNRILNLDKTFRPFILIVVGYPQSPIKVPDIKRKSLYEIMQEY